MYAARKEDFTALAELRVPTKRSPAHEPILPHTEGILHEVLISLDSTRRLG
jgi:hypothetical protein